MDLKDQGGVRPLDKIVKIAMRIRMPKEAS